MCRALAFLRTVTSIAPTGIGISPGIAQELCMHECKLISDPSDLNMQKCTVRCTSRHFLWVRFGNDEGGETA
jgi:hypothetical protein